ncbi:hypothetical protein DOE51_06195 [Bdellovibrio sp. NC01]|nr:hypothetical protein DOE51_06195 [Bdellovibrio sp. NC01]
MACMVCSAGVVNAKTVRFVYINHGGFVGSLKVYSLPSMQEVYEGPRVQLGYGASGEVNVDDSVTDFYAVVNVLHGRECIISSVPLKGDTITVLSKGTTLSNTCEIYKAEW